MVTFIIHFKDGHRFSVSTRYSEDDEHEVDAAWDYIYGMYPEADYIERF
jgi:hypothetical protein